MEWLTSLPPYSLFFIGAIVVLFCRGIVASIVTVIVPVLSFIILLQLQHGSSFQYSLMGMDLTLVKLDRLSLLLDRKAHV